MIRKKVYISGAISNTTGDYKRRFAIMDDMLQCLGYDTVNPANLSEVMRGEFTWRDYMNVCFAMLMKCDAICMMDGWEESDGAIIEYRAALKSGLEIMSEYEIERENEKRTC